MACMAIASKARITSGRFLHTTNALAALTSAERAYLKDAGRVTKFFKEDLNSIIQVHSFSDWELPAVKHALARYFLDPSLPNWEVPKIDVDKSLQGEIKTRWTHAKKAGRVGSMSREANKRPLIAVVLDAMVHVTNYKLAVDNEGNLEKLISLTF